MQTKIKSGGLKSSVLLRELQDVIDLCFVLMEDMCYREISNATGLSAVTVWKYKCRPVTLYVRYGTVVSLAAAAGLRLKFEETGIRLFVVGK